MYKSQKNKNIDTNQSPTGVKGTLHPNFTKANIHKKDHIPVKLQRELNRSKRKPTKSYTDFDGKLDELSENLPPIKLNNLDFTTMANRAGPNAQTLHENTLLDIQVETAYLEGNTRVSDISKEIMVSTDRVRSSLTRVQTRWQIYGTFRKLEELRGQRIASIDRKFRLYWELLDISMSNLNNARESITKEFKQKKPKADILKAYKTELNEALAAALRILNDMHKWEELYNNVLGVTTKFIERQYLLNLTTLEIGSMDRGGLTPEEQITMRKVEDAFAEELMKLVKSGEF